MLPEDEDGISFLMFEDEEGQTEENDYFQMVQDGALDYQIGEKGKGYLQSLEDEDWYRVTPDENWDLRNEVFWYEGNRITNDGNLPASR